jgi:Fe-S oxidoreductase
VNIDTAEVSILEREVLAARRARSTAWPTRTVLAYLASRSGWTNRVVRRAFLQWGGVVQRTGARIIRRRWRPTRLLGPFYAPAPPIAARPLAAWCPPQGSDHALVVSPEREPSATVFYFPGCGSERLHADIALAAIYLLLQFGLRVVLPPKYLCCGFPARANAKSDLNSRQELQNTIIFNQIRSMLGDLVFDACLITCGTCREALMRVNAADIFDAPIYDAVAFLLDRGMDMQLEGPLLYHQPCHDSMDGRGEVLLRAIAPGGVVPAPECCSEAGTLALSRPDIAAAMLGRKRSSLITAADRTPRGRRLLTNCPACLNGLGRSGVAPPMHVAVALAEGLAREGWKAQVVDRLARAEKIRF